MDDMFLSVPMPPTLNTLYPTCGKRRILSKEGKIWYAKALFFIRSQAVGRERFGKNRVSLTVYLRFSNKHRCDIDNRTKILSDAITKAGIWADDSQVDELHVFRDAETVEVATADIIIRAISASPTSDSA